MATSRFFVQRDAKSALQGPYDLKQLKECFARGVITLNDFVRDADRTNAVWKRIADLPELVARLKSGSSSSPEPSAAATQSNFDKKLLRKDAIAMILGATSLVVTVLNTSWMLFANAESPNKASPPRAATPQAPIVKPAGPDIVPDGKHDGVNRKQEQMDKLDEVMKKLDQINSRVVEIGRQKEAVSSQRLMSDAVESGVLEFQVGDARFRFIFVPAGTFRFGYPAEDQNRVVNATGNPNAFLNATPECILRVERGFFMLDRELTERQWNSCTDRSAEAKPKSDTAGAEDGANLDLPKRNISWVEANSFCSDLQRVAPGLSAVICKVRLPTEIEWEYAGRGSQGLQYPWVPQVAGSQQFFGASKATATSPKAVDASANKDCTWRGQFDFAGNVSEWCLDRYEQSLHEAIADHPSELIARSYDPADDPIVKQAMSEKKGDGNPSRTLRGGSVIDSPESCELPMRRFLLQNKSAEHIGLRPVIVLLRHENFISQDDR